MLCRTVHPLLEMKPIAEQSMTELLFYHKYLISLEAIMDPGTLTPAIVEQAQALLSQIEQEIDKKEANYLTIMQSIQHRLDTQAVQLSPTKLDEMLEQLDSIGMFGPPDVLEQRDELVARIHGLKG